MQDASRIDDATVQTLATNADADPRSVVRFLAGLPVRGRAGRRIADAAALLGVVPKRATSKPPKGAA